MAMQLSIAQRIDGLDVIKVDTGHFIHFGYDDLRVQLGTPPHEIVLGVTSMRPRDRILFASEAWQSAIDFGHAHRLI